MDSCLHRNDRSEVILCLFGIVAGMTNLKDRFLTSIRNDNVNDEILNQVQNDGSVVSRRKMRRRIYP